MIDKGITLSYLICGEGNSLVDMEKLLCIWCPSHNTLVLVELLWRRHRIINELWTYLPPRV
jgi:hypothetical protein